MHRFGSYLLSCVVVVVSSLTNVSSLHAQQTMIGAEDASMMDALALLFFGEQEGRKYHSAADPVRRSVTNGGVVYEFIEPNLVYGSTKHEGYFQDTVGSRYLWIHNTLRQTAPCVVRIDSTIEYSHGDSKDAFGVHVATTTFVVDLSNHRLFAFENELRFRWPRSSRATRLFASRIHRPAWINTSFDRRLKA